MRRRAVTQRAFQPAAASHSLPARAPTAPHLAQHTSHATLCAPRFARSTSHAARSTHHARKTTNAPTRRGAAVLSARRRLTLASGSRADRTSQCAAHSARATRHAHDLARRSLSHAHTHQREIRRTARSTLPAHRRLALASNSRADRTTQFAKQHAPAHCAPSPLRTRAHTSVRNTPRTHHVARLAPHTAHTQRSPSAPPRSPSAHAPRLASSPARRVTMRAAVGAGRHRHATKSWPPNRALQGWRLRSPPVFARARAVTSPETPNSARRAQVCRKDHCCDRCITHAEETSERGRTHTCRVTASSSTPGWLVTHRPSGLCGRVTVAQHHIRQPGPGKAGGGVVLTAFETPLG